MIGIQKSHNAPVIHFNTAGNFHWADLEAARLAIQSSLVQYGRVCVLESCEAERQTDENDEVNRCRLLWDEIAQHFSSSDVPAVSIVCDMDSMDICSPYRLRQIRTRVTQLVLALRNCCINETLRWKWMAD